jgi:KISS1 receptor
MSAATVTPAANMSSSLSFEVSAATQALIHTVVSSSSQSVIIRFFQYICLVIGVVGLAANGFIVFVLIYYKYIGKSATNKFIFNQTILDAVCCSWLTVFVVVQWAAAPIGDGANAWFRCFLVDSMTPLVASAVASQFSILIITAERYARVVHPLRHRKHFHPWMVYLGLILPWLNGLFVFVIPGWSTTRIVKKRCMYFAFWPTYDMYRAFNVVVLVWQCGIPVCIIAYCYARIINVIRRQTIKVGQSTTTAARRGPTSTGVWKEPLTASTTVCGPSNGPLAEEMHDAGPLPSNPEDVSQAVSKTEKKVIRTLIVIVVCFVVCWSPVYICTVIVNFYPTPAANIFNTVFTILAYVNPVANPIIYGAHFDAVRRFAGTIGGHFTR